MRIGGAASLPQPRRGRPSEAQPASKPLNCRWLVASEQSVRRRRESIDMMCEQGGNQERWLHSFNLEDHVPADHWLQFRHSLRAPPLRGGPSESCLPLVLSIGLEDRIPDHSTFSKNRRAHVTEADTIIYRFSQADCAKCPLKDRCCPDTPTRKIARSAHESAPDVARDVAKTATYKQSRKVRKKVEMPFAHLKQIMIGQSRTVEDCLCCGPSAPIGPGLGPNTVDHNVRSRPILRL